MGGEGSDGVCDDGRAARGAGRYRCRVEGLGGCLGAVREVCLSLTGGDLCSLGQKVARPSG